MYLTEQQQNRYNGYLTEQKKYQYDGYRVRMYDTEAAEAAVTATSLQGSQRKALPAIRGMAFTISLRTN